MEPHSGLNNLDFVVLGVILLSGLLAMMRGFTREIFSLLAWTGAYFAAAKFYPLATPTMHHYVKNDKAAEWAAMAAVFLVALFVLMIIGSLISTLVKGKALTVIDRSLGFVYGVARGAVVVSLVYLGAVMIFWPDIDKPALANEAAAASEQTTDKTPADKNVDKDRNTPPDLLLQAKTRPAMAYGAERLKVFVPQEMIDKSLKNIDAQRLNAEKAADQKTLDRLSTPIPAQPGTGAAPIDINRTEGNKR